ncbi:MAG: glycosyltransferase family 4 protein [Thermoplasmataceae archaeon]
MQVTLIGNKFVNDGYGVASASGLLYQYLQNRINVNAISLEDFKLPSVLKGIARRNLSLIAQSNRLNGLYLHSMEPDILHLVIPYTAKFNFLRKPKKKIVTLHDFYPFDRFFVDNEIRRMQCRHMLLENAFNKFSQRVFKYLDMYDHIITDTPEIRNRAIERLNIDVNKITSIGLIIDEKFKPNLSRKSENKLIIGYINNYNWNKTQYLAKFIDAFKKVKNRELELHLYGKGFPFHDLINGDQRIKYFGYLSDERVVDTYNSFSAYLSTSVVEGFGIPILQAKACKVPVLCYDGNIPKSTKNNTTLWNEDNITNILENTLWTKNSTDAAFNDIAIYRPKNIIDMIIYIYEKVFQE